MVLVTLEGHLYTLGTGEQGQLGRVAEIFSNRGGRQGLGKSSRNPRADRRHFHTHRSLTTSGFLRQQSQRSSCDFRTVPDTTACDRQRQSSVRRCILWLVRHLCRVKGWAHLWIWPQQLPPAWSVCRIWIMDHKWLEYQPQHHLVTKEFFFLSFHLGTKNTKACFFPVKLACFKNSTTSWVEFSGGQHHTVCLDDKGKVQLTGFFALDPSLN